MHTHTHTLCFFLIAYSLYWLHVVWNMKWLQKKGDRSDRFLRKWCSFFISNAHFSMMTFSLWCVSIQFFLWSLLLLLLRFLGPSLLYSIYTFFYIGPTSRAINYLWIDFWAISLSLFLLYSNFTFFRFQLFHYCGTCTGVPHNFGPQVFCRMNPHEYNGVDELRLRVCVLIKSRRIFFLCVCMKGTSFEFLFFHWFGWFPKNWIPWSMPTFYGAKFHHHHHHCYCH